MRTLERNDVKLFYQQVDKLEGKSIPIALAEELKQDAKWIIAGN